MPCHLAPRPTLSGEKRGSPAQNQVARIPNSGPIGTGIAVPQPPPAKGRDLPQVPPLPSQLALRCAPSGEAYLAQNQVVRHPSTGPIGASIPASKPLLAPGTPLPSQPSRPCTSSGSQVPQNAHSQIVQPPNSGPTGAGIQVPASKHSSQGTRLPSQPGRHYIPSGNQIPPSLNQPGNPSASPEKQVPQPIQSQVAQLPGSWPAGTGNTVPQLPQATGQSFHRTSPSLGQPGSQAIPSGNQGPRTVQSHAPQPDSPWPAGVGNMTPQLPQAASQGFHQASPSLGQPGSHGKQVPQPGQSHVAYSPSSWPDEPMQDWDAGSWPAEPGGTVPKPPQPTSQGFPRASPSLNQPPRPSSSSTGKPSMLSNQPRRPSMTSWKEGSPMVNHPDRPSITTWENGAPVLSQLGDPSTLPRSQIYQPAQGLAQSAGHGPIVRPPSVGGTKMAIPIPRHHPAMSPAQQTRNRMAQPGIAPGPGRRPSKESPVLGPHASQIHKPSLPTKHALLLNPAARALLRQSSAPPSGFGTAPAPAHGYSGHGAAVPSEPSKPIARVPSMSPDHFLLSSEAAHLAAAHAGNPIAITNQAIPLPLPKHVLHSMDAPLHPIPHRPQAPLSPAAQYRSDIQHRNEQLYIGKTERLQQEAQWKSQVPRSMVTPEESRALNVLKAMSPMRQKRVEMGHAGTHDSRGVPLGLFTAQQALFPPQQYPASQLRYPSNHPFVQPEYPPGHPYLQRSSAQPQYPSGQPRYPSGRPQFPSGYPPGHPSSAEAMDVEMDMGVPSG